DENLASIRLVKTVQDRHQGRFSRAVFANDPVNRACRDHQADVAVGMDRAEALIDALQFDCSMSHTPAAFPWKFIFCSMGYHAACVLPTSTSCYTSVLNRLPRGNGR